VQGNIAQVIALTTHAKAFLAGNPTIASSAFYPGNSTFVFCEYVLFLDLELKGDGWKESEYAPDPVVWFSRLKEARASSVRMYNGPKEPKKLRDKHVTDRMLVGFVGGGGRWLIEVVTPTGSDFWEARWEVGDRNRTDKRIWRVTYGRIAKNRPTPPPQPHDTAAIKRHLTDNLKAIGAFAQAQKLEGFAKAFDASLAHLNSTDPFKGVYHADLAPQGALPLDASQLLAAAQAAWVFGGMGSWNDLGFDGEDQTKYDRLSEELYQLLNSAIVAAANAGNRPPEPRPPSASTTPPIAHRGTDQ
jgi:hypothetical protein